ncbi:pentapeptide repeat-containing protein [Helicobacter anatolicus]|uniref:pentapeptide repeat-containing protein n=1 Tax=Helicobacter anatolicus TaxID=2905874 RepID=UPI001E4F7252|nr:pentapeptide repeat-containing protein [Helicobacter anatolicus]MCE3040502.1 pentapeptide repeat-containing protein [Helicobacter anatolicus]
MTINLPIQENENVRIIGIDPNNHTLTICDFQTSSSPHIISASHIYDTLEACDKNLCDGKKIIEKEETSNEVIYHFNYGLSITSVSSCTSGIYCFSFGVLGCKESAKKNFEYTKQYRWDGRDYRSIFHGPVYLTCSFLERVHFAHCEFHKILSTQANPELLGRIEICNGISFGDCKFFDEVRLMGIVFGVFFERNKYFKNAQSSSFENCYFEKKCDLSRSTFCNQIRFDGAEFSENSDFQECVFQCHASFYKCIFKKPVNFSQVNFKEGVNFVNSKMDFTFYEFREFVDQLVREKYPHQKSHKEKVIDCVRTILYHLKIIKNENENDLKFKEKKEKNRYREKVAKDFQDSFRLLKHIANRDGNTLLASNYHKFELYAHEIALIGVEDRGIKAKTYEEVFRNLALIGKTINRWQLAFYRHLSDHHTSLLKVFNNLLIVVSACFLMNVYYLNLFKVYETTKIMDMIENFLKQNQINPYFIAIIFIALTLVKCNFFAVGLKVIE